MVKCQCAVCRSSNPRNFRNRSCFLLELPEGSAIIDTPPEFRITCIKHNVQHVDAVLYTHHHADHVCGFDDVRGFTDHAQNPLPVYADEATLTSLESMFPYAFKQAPAGLSLPRVELITIDGCFGLLGEEIQPIRVLHGKLPVMAYRIRNVAVVTDVSSIPTDAEDMLQDLDVLLLDAVRYRPHPTHYHMDAALEVVKRLRPRKTYFIHLSHDYDHDVVNAQLPDNIELAYDGLRIPIW
ncbi:MAG: MBL fold metallo-hydrolase [Armatimonadota bacterium]